MFRRVGLALSRGARREAQAAAAVARSIDWAAEDRLDDLFGVPRGVPDLAAELPPPSLPTAPKHAPPPPPTQPLPPPAPSSPPHRSNQALAKPAVAKRPSDRPGPHSFLDAMEALQAGDRKSPAYAADFRRAWDDGLPAAVATCSEPRHAALICRTALADPRRCTLPADTAASLAALVGRDTQGMRHKGFACAARCLTAALAQHRHGALRSFGPIVLRELQRRFQRSGAAADAPAARDATLLLESSGNALEALAALRPLCEARDGGPQEPGVVDLYEAAAARVLATVQHHASDLRVTEAVHAVVLCRQLDRPGLRKECRRAAVALCQALQRHDARFVNALHFARVVFAFNALSRPEPRSAQADHAAKGRSGGNVWAYLKAKYAAERFDRRLPADTAAKVEAMLAKHSG